MWPNPQETADLVTFTEEIRNRKLLFLCSVCLLTHNLEPTKRLNKKCYQTVTVTIFKLSINERMRKSWFRSRKYWHFWQSHDSEIKTNKFCLAKNVRKIFKTCKFRQIFHKNKLFLGTNLFHSLNQGFYNSLSIYYNLLREFKVSFLRQYPKLHFENAYFYENKKLFHSFSTAMEKWNVFHGFWPEYSIKCSSHFTLKRSLGSIAIAPATDTVVFPNNYVFNTR